MTGPHKNPRISTQRHSAETRAKIGVGARSTRLNEVKPCPYDCGVETNNGSMVRHIASQHTFVCRVPDCVSTKHKGYGLCDGHWKIHRACAKYGTTIDIYLATFTAQNGKCAICQKQCTISLEGIGRNMNTTCIDHDHSTGKFRGLICGNCNAGIGQLKDDINILKAAIKYLENSRDT